MKTARRVGSGTRFLGSVAQDIMFALRTLRKHVLYSVVAVATLGLCIGSATAMFSVVNGVLIRSVPFAASDRLFNVWQVVEGARGAPGLVGQTWDKLPISRAQYADWLAANTAFEAVGVHNAVQATLTGVGSAERIWKGLGSASLMNVLGTNPAMGRWFSPDEEEHESARVTVISHEMWQSRLGGDPDVLGRVLTLDGSDHTIIGVLPAGFRLRYLGMHWLGADRTGRRDLWVSIGARGLGGGNNLEAIARLSPGVQAEHAHTETTRILEIQRPGARVRLVPRRIDETHGLTSPLTLLLGATGLLLLIGCGNVAALSLGELLGRRQELVTRSALGAGAARIARQLLTESLVLGAFGGLVGVALAYSGTALLVIVAPPLPRLETVGVDGGVLAFAVLLGMVSAVLFGTLPALWAAKGAAALTTRGGSRTGTLRRGRFERAVVALEIAVTVVLLVAGGLLARSLSRILAVDPGFDPTGLATAGITLPANEYDTDESTTQAFAELVAGLESIPGVSSATIATRLPFPGLTNTTSLRIVGRDGNEDQLSAQQVRVWPGFSAAMGMPLVAGRVIADTDGPNDPTVMLISNNIAQRYWPDGSAVGARVRGFGRGEVTIVGVVEDVKRNRLNVAADPVFYTSLRQMPSSDVRLVARTSGDPALALAAIRGAVRTFDHRVPVRDLKTMDSLIRESAGEERYRTLLMAVFGALAAILAAVGVFGVAARGVARRTREFGIRLALGAENGGLLAHVMRGSLLVSLVGTALGLAGAALLSRVLAKFLFGVTSWDPMTYTTVALALMSVCLVACYVPARRLMKVDPVDVLRAE